MSWFPIALSPLIVFSFAVNATSTPRSPRPFVCGSIGEKFRITGLIKADNNLANVTVLTADFKKRNYAILGTIKNVKLTSRRLGNRRNPRVEHFYAVKVGGGWDPLIRAKLGVSFDYGYDEDSYGMVQDPVTMVPGAEINVESKGNDSRETYSLECGPER